jgi:putative FmdB family regulatory protein
MPTYEYECKSCSHSFETFQSMSDQPLKDCPKCGSEVRRLIFGGSGVIFKGSGFYVTDKKKSTDKSGKNTTGTNKKPSSDNKSQNSESSQSTPAVSSPCSECPKKGVSASCPA